MLMINQKSLSFLIVLSFIFLIFTAVPAMAEHFEVGTQFGWSHIVPEEKNTSYNVMNTVQFPSGIVFAGSSPSAFYFTWFGGERFGVGTDVAFSRLSITEEKRWWGRERNVEYTLFESGYYAQYFVRGHENSSPYVQGRVSWGITAADSIFFDSTAFTSNFGVGVGYQARFSDTFVMRTGASYRRVIVSYEDADEIEQGNQFSIFMSIGTRFGW